MSYNTNPENQSVQNEEKKSEETTTLKQHKFKLRTVIVMATILLFALGLGIAYRANYVEMLEIGENYADVFTKNLKYKLLIGGANFAFAFILMCITNGLIKKGLKKFFEEDKKEVPKLPNKSIALIVAIIAAIITPNLFIEKVIFFLNNTQFGITEPIFNMDVGFYMFQAPLI